MISPAIILAQYLIAQGTFTDPALATTWPLFISSMPDGDTIKPEVGVIYDTDGLKDGRLMTGENIFHHGLQVRVRASTYDDGYNQAQAVVDLFQAVENETITVDSVDYIVHNISQLSSILPLGPEEGTKRRDLFTINFMATIKES